jgi:hypothetical protein
MIAASEMSHCVLGPLCRILSLNKNGHLTRPPTTCHITIVVITTTTTTIIIIIIIIIMS